jgi:polysaccharide biosynthesis protein PelB
MDQRRSRLRAPDASLRERIISTGGLFTVAAMVVLVLVLLYPRNTLIAKLQSESLDDPLSAHYLTVLLRSETGDNDLVLLLAERHRALSQFDRAATVLRPLLSQAKDPSQRRRAHLLLLDVRQQQLAAQELGEGQAKRLRDDLLQTLKALPGTDLEHAQLLDFVRLATVLGDVQLARQFAAQIAQASAASPGSGSGSSSGSGSGVEAVHVDSFDEAVRKAIGAQDYLGAAQLHRDAMDATDSPDERRNHLMMALRILRSGNRLDDALQLAREHDGVVGSDGMLLRYLIELALAANRPAVGGPYARRLMRMSRLETREPAWIEHLVDLVVPSAHAATPAAAAVPNADEPQLPFDDATYQLAYQTFLANSNLADAYRVARAAVRQMPDRRAWRERLAQVAEWHGHPDDALTQWRWLATHSQATTEVEQALAQVLRLAGNLNDHGAQIEAWQQIARQRPLSQAEYLGLVTLHEQLGQPQDALALLLERDALDPQTVWIETRVALLERLGDVPATITALEQLMARDGATRERAMRLAGMHTDRGDVRKAYEALAPLADQTPEQDVEVWQLLAELTWALQLEPEALRALQVRSRSESFSSEEADRLIALLRERQPDEAAQLAEVTWRRLQRPDYLMLAIELWWSRRDLGQLQRLYASVTPEEQAQLPEQSAFLHQRSLWQTARGEHVAARLDMRRALAADPQDVGLRSTLIFMLIDAGERGELARLVGETVSTGGADARLDAAMAAAYGALGQPRRALPFWRRQAAAQRGDALWMFGYAEALQAADWPQVAQAVQRQALQAIRQRQVDPAQADGQARALMLQVARLTLERAPGDPSLVVLRHLLRLQNVPGGAAFDAAANELALSWLMSSEQFEPARVWLWQRYARLLAAPPWAALMLALHERDLDTVQRLYTKNLAVLPASTQIEALSALGRRAEAHDLRVAELARRDDDALHEALVAEAWARPRAFESSWAQRRSGVQASVATVVLRAPVDAATQAELQLDRTTLASTDPRALTGVPEQAQALRLTLQHAIDSSTNLTLGLGRHGAWADTTGLALALHARLDASVQMHAGIDWNQPADESSPLAVAGVRHRLQLAADLGLAPTVQARIELHALAFGLQNGPRLGSGLGLDWTLTQWLRLAQPDLSLRVFGSHRRHFRADVTLPAATAQLNPAGSVPGTDFFVPSGYALYGVGVSSGLTLHEGISRAWRPFADLSLTHHDQLGVGHGASFGLAGSVLGGDQLALFVSSLRDGAGGSNRATSLRYALRF